jgi:hypothetical protein
MLRWQVLSPSATVGNDLSVVEAGLCCACNRPWEEGETWVALAKYDDSVSLGETIVVHDRCVEKVQGQSAVEPGAFLPIPIFSDQEPSKLSSRWERGKGTTILHHAFPGSSLPLFHFPEDTKCSLHGGLVATALKCGGTKEGRQGIAFTLVHEQYKARVPTSTDFPDPDKVSLVWLRDEQFAEVEAALQLAKKYSLASALREGRLNLGQKKVD